MSWRSASAMGFVLVGVGGCGRAVGSSSGGGDASGEICTDGIDNNGDGLVDCADPQCMPAHSCELQPAGWTLAAYLPALPGQGAPACPTGFTAERIEVEGPATNVACHCNCGSSCGEVLCEGDDTVPPGPVSVAQASGDAGCAEGDAATLATYGCVPYALTAGWSVELGPAPVWQGPALTEEYTSTEHPSALLCVAGPPGGGCEVGRVCTPKPASGWNLCPYIPQEVDGAALSAEEACPSNWIAAVTVDGAAPTAVAVATMWDDSLACSKCDCEPLADAGCAEAGLTLYTDPSCSSPSITVVPEVCATLPESILSARYSATPVNAGCTTPTPPTPTGIDNSAPNAGFVVCCPPHPP